MSDLSWCNDVIAAFAQSCEEIGSYANRIRHSGKFEFVTTGTDIRRCQSGWHLERWIEASLNVEEGRELCWWLELKGHDKVVTVRSHITISYSDYDLSFPDKTVTTTAELKNALSTAVNELTTASITNESLKQAIEQHKAH